MNRILCIYICYGHWWYCFLRRQGCQACVGVLCSRMQLTGVCVCARPGSTFGRPLAKHGIIQQYIGESRIDIDTARQLVRGFSVDMIPYVTEHSPHCRHE